MEAQTKPKRRGRPTNAERAAKAAALSGTVGDILKASAKPAQEVPAQPAPEPPSEAPNAPQPQIQAVAERPEMREPMREESSREAADRKAREWFQHIDSLPAGRDKYFVDPNAIPDGWTYEWKTHTVVGKENPQYQVELQRSAWTPVPANRHPEMMPTGFGGATIDIDGMRLMERPKAITAFQKAKDERNARAPVQNIREKLSGAPAGTFERGGHPGAPVAVKTAYGPPDAKAS